MKYAITTHGFEPDDWQDVEYDHKDKKKLAEMLAYNHVWKVGELDTVDCLFVHFDTGIMVRVMIDVQVNCYAREMMQ